MTGRASRDFDFVVAGGGVTGSVMAALLLARGLSVPGRVAVIDGPDGAERVGAERVSPERGGGEPGPAPDATPWDLRVFALSRASERVLSACGTWQTFPAGKRFAYERMCVWDANGSAGGKGSLSFDCAELGEPDLGFIVEGRTLRTRCRGTARDAGAVFFEAAIAAVDVGDDAASIRLSDGRTLAARLLIVADGCASPTRELLGIGIAGHAYHQDALVAHVRTEKPHRNTAWQRFLATGPLAFLPLPGGLSSIVWSAQRATADRLRSLDAAAFAAALTQASGGMLGECEPVTPIATFPLQLQYALEYIGPHCVLVGDAAHAVHPLAGQGLNLGLLDCATLVEVLSQAGVAYGDRRALRSYERRRRSENLLAAAALDGLERLFSSRNPALGRLRMAGLGALERAPSVKRLFAARALGLRGDVPAFLQELPGR